MSGSDRPIHVAVSDRLVMDLDLQIALIPDLIATWLDMDKYMEASARIDRMRAYARAIPRMVGPWSRVLISHTQLVQCAWEAARRGDQVQHAATVAIALEINLEALMEARETARLVADNGGKT